MGFTQRLIQQLLVFVTVKNWAAGKSKNTTKFCTCNLDLLGSVKEIVSKDASTLKTTENKRSVRGYANDVDSTLEHSSLMIVLVICLAWVHDKNGHLTS